MSDSVRPHGRQPTRFPRPWDSLGKNTGVGCHFLLQWMKVKSESEVTQSCPTLHDSMDCGPPGSSTMEFSRQEYWSGVPSLITKLLLFGLFRFPLFLHFSPFPDQTYFLTQVFPQTEGRLRTWGGAVRSYRILLHSLSES